MTNKQFKNSIASFHLEESEETLLEDTLDFFYYHIVIRGINLLVFW